MKPGRELDALVAEKVMGYKVYNFGLMSVEHNLTTIASLQKEGVNLPYYSSVIHHAWLVVEKFVTENHSDGYDFRLEARSNGWFCCISPFEPVEGIDTAPHAICLASLKAVEVDLAESLGGLPKS